MDQDAVADVDVLRAVLEGEHAEVWAHARARLSEPELALRPGLAPDEHRDRVAAQLRHLAGDRLVLDGFPEHLGGGGDVAGFVTGFQALAYGDLSLLIKVGVQYGLFGGALLHLGTADHHERFLRDALALRLPGCFAMTEVGHGSDVAAVRTTATHDRETDELVVATPDPAAAKNWIGNAARDGRAAVVFCQLTTQGPDDDGPVGQGVHAVVVPIRDAAGEVLPGVTAVGDGLKMGLNGVDNGLLAFDDVRVPRANLLDRFAAVEVDGTYRSPIASPQARFFTMLATLVQGRVSIAGAAVAVAKVALAVAVGHGLTRRQFTNPTSGEEVLLLDHTAHQRRLMPLVASTWAYHAAHARLAADLGALADDDGGDGRRELETRAAGLKALCSWHATETVQQAREACGGVGYLAAYRLPALKADSDIFTTFEGDNTVLLQLVAKNLLVGFRSDLESMNLLETGRMVAEQAVDQVLHRTGVRQLLQRLADVVPGTQDQEEDLTDPRAQLSLLAWREEHLLVSVGRRLRAGLQTGRGTTEVFDAVQDHLLLAARAYVDRLALQAAVDLVDATPEGPEREVVATAVALHGARVLEAERGWLLERGRINPGRAKALPPLVIRLSAELRPHAAALVDAFGVPDAVLVDPDVVARHVTGTAPLDRTSRPAVPVEPA